MGFNKSKFLILGSFGAAALAVVCLALPSGVSAEISQSIFPQAIEGRELYTIEEVDFAGWAEVEEYGLREYSKAYYIDDTGEIDVDIIRIKDAKEMDRFLSDLIREVKEFIKEEQGATSKSTQSTEVMDYPAQYFRATVGAYYLDLYFKYVVKLFVPVSNYLVLVTIAEDAGEPSLTNAKSIAEHFVESIEGEVGSGGGGGGGEPPGPEDSGFNPVELVVKACNFDILELRPFAECLFGILTEALDYDIVEIVADTICDVIVGFYEAKQVQDSDPREYEKRISQVLFNSAEILIDYINVFDNAWGVYWELVDCVDDFIAAGRGAVWAVRTLWSYAIEAYMQACYRMWGMTLYMVSIFSPADVLVETSEGRVGIDENGKMYNEVEGAIYTHIKDADIKVVLIPNIWERGEDWGEPSVKVFATGQGEVDIAVAKITEDGQQTFQEYNDIDITEKTVISMEPDEDVKIDKDGDGRYEKKISEPDEVRTAKLKRKGGGGKYVLIVLLVLVVIGLVVALVKREVKKRRK